MGGGPGQLGRVSSKIAFFKEDSLKIFFKDFKVIPYYKYKHFNYLPR